MLVLDDTLLLSTAFFADDIMPMPNLYLLVFNALRTNALQEMYPLEKTQDAIKENRLCFELGEIPLKQYEATHARLLEKLRMARKVKELRVDSQVNAWTR